MQVWSVLAIILGLEIVLGDLLETRDSRFDSVKIQEVQENFHNSSFNPKIQKKTYNATQTYSVSKEFKKNSESSQNRVFFQRRIQILTKMCKIYSSHLLLVQQIQNFPDKKKFHPAKRRYSTFLEHEISSLEKKILKKYHYLNPRYTITKILNCSKICNGLETSKTISYILPLKDSFSVSGVHLKLLKLMHAALDNIKKLEKSSKIQREQMLGSIIVNIQSINKLFSRSFTGNMKSRIAFKQKLSSVFFFSQAIKYIEQESDTLEQKIYLELIEKDLEIIKNIDHNVTLINALQPHKIHKKIAVEKASQIVAVCKEIFLKTEILNIGQSMKNLLGTIQDFTNYFFIFEKDLQSFIKSQEKIVFYLSNELNQTNTNVSTNFFQIAQGILRHKKCPSINFTTKNSAYTKNNFSIPDVKLVMWKHLKNSHDALISVEKTLNFNKTNEKYQDGVDFLKKAFLMEQKLQTVIHQKELKLPKKAHVLFYVYFYLLSEKWNHLGANLSLISRPKSNLRASKTNFEVLAPNNAQNNNTTSSKKVTVFSENNLFTKKDFGDKKYVEARIQRMPLLKPQESLQNESLDQGDILNYFQDEIATFLELCLQYRLWIVVIQFESELEKEMKIFKPDSSYFCGKSDEEVKALREKILELKKTARIQIPESQSFYKNWFGEGPLSVCPGAKKLQRKINNFTLETGKRIHDTSERLAGLQEAEMLRVFVIMIKIAKYAEIWLDDTDIYDFSILHDLETKWAQSKTRAHELMKVFQDEKNQRHKIYVKYLNDLEEVWRHMINIPKDAN